MRILLCPSSFYPNVGGVEEVARNLGKSLLKAGVQVAVAVNRYPEELPECDQLENLPVRRFEFMYPARNLDTLLRLPRAIQSQRLFSSFVDEFKPDLVHVICPSSNCLYVSLTRQAVPFRLIVSFHGELMLDDNALYQRSPFARWCLRRLLRQADGVTGCSQFVLDDARRSFKWKGLLEQVIYNGIDFEERESGSITSAAAVLAGKRYIMAIGRLVEIKGFDYLIRAFAALPQQLPETHLVIAGEGQQHGALQALVDQLDLRQRVHFLGNVKRGDIWPLLAGCLFLVMPSPVESFGIVCLEAMSAGKPVIASNSGGPPEYIVNGQEGFLVPPRDMEALSAAMNKLLSDDQARIIIGQSALAKAKDFGWPAITDGYLEFYRRVLAGGLQAGGHRG